MLRSRSLSSFPTSAAGVLHRLAGLSGVALWAALVPALACSSKVATAVKCGAMQLGPKYAEPELASLPDGTPVCSFLYDGDVRVLIEPIADEAGLRPGRAWVDGAEAPGLEQIGELIKARGARSSVRANRHIELPSSPRWERFPPVTALVTLSSNGQLRVSIGDSFVVPIDGDDVFQFARNVRDGFPGRPFELHADGAARSRDVLELMSNLTLAGVAEINLATATPPQEGDQLLTSNGGLTVSVDDVTGGGWDGGATYQDMVTLLASR